MRTILRRRPGPALVVSACALFFAVGGSAFAVGHAKAPAPQVRCATGAIKGIAYVTGDPKVGLANLPNTYSNDSSLFGATFNCTGGTIEVKKDSTVSGNPAIDVHFVGNPGGTAIGTAISSTEPAALTVSRLPDGSFRVIIGGNGSAGEFTFRNNVSFVLVLI